MKPIEVPRCSLAVTFTATLLMLLPRSGMLLQFDRKQVLLQNEWWRMISGHLVHWSNEHFFFDALSVLVAGALAESMTRGGRLASLETTLWLLFGALLTSVVTLLHPSMESYRGLSAVSVQLYSFVAALLLARGIEQKQRRQIVYGGTALFALLAKLIWELELGLPMFVHTSNTPFVVALHAHVVGCFVGILWALRAKYAGDAGKILDAS